MTRASLIGSFGLWATLAVVNSVQAQTPTSGGARGATETSPVSTAQLSQLSDEVKRLTGEVHQLQMELQGWKLRQLETDLREVESEQQRLVAHESELNQVIAELEQQLGNSTLRAEERQTMETAKSELTDGQMRKLRDAQQTAGERKAELSRLLERERGRWQGLVAKIKELKLVADAIPQP